MPKCLTIRPEEVRRRHEITLKPIQANSYERSFKEELERYSREDLRRIHRDMVIIRTFESHLLEVSLRGNYKGVEYSHRGPAHLSLGMEAAAVGQAYYLGPEDQIYGSHRSHGDILAKGLAAIQRLDERTLLSTMEGFFGGAALRVVEGDQARDAKELAINHLIYAAMAEIYHRQTGLNRGMGGSMHAFFPPYGIYPNNAIVGASADIAVGAALFKKVNRRPGVVVCNIGDGAVACGPFWEALNFATMGQFHTLWEEPYRGGLPLIMNVNNNFYAMGGQTCGETSGMDVIARIGAGLNPDQMHCERIDGYNPLAVIDAYRRKLKVVQEGAGPVLLDTLAYRFSGHSPSDAGTYREKEEIDAWRLFDPIDVFARNLIDHQVVTADELDADVAVIEELIFRNYSKAVDDRLSPREDIHSIGCPREATMFSNQRIPNLDPSRQPEIAAVTGDNPRIKALQGRSRSAFDEQGQRLPKGRSIQVRDAIFEALLHGFQTDSTLIAYGEENRDWGGAFAVYRGLTELLPYHRLFNSPIAEGAIVGAAVGYGLQGGRCVVELMYCDFLGRCGDEVFNQLAKWQAMSGGLLKMPVVIRLMVGSMYGAQHSQDWSSLCAHIPGLKVVYPATPFDAKGLMNAALAGTDPVLFFESQRLYDVAEEFEPGGVPEGYYEVPIGQPVVRRPGKDFTILSIGPTLYRALETADILHAQYGLSAEVIDARSIVPFDYAPVLESVRKTRKLVLTSDAVSRGSILHTFASQINMLAYDELDGPPVVVGARNWIAPAYEVEHLYIPHPSDLLDAIHEYILPLRGYQPKRPSGAAEYLRRSAQGL